MKDFKNPIVPLHSSFGVGTSDPYVIRYEGRYYHCYSAKEGIYVSSCKELSDLESAERRLIYACPKSGIGSSWFAPELHRMGDRWYIYGAPVSTESGLHSMAVLGALGDSPMSDYEFLGGVSPLWEHWNLDGTVLFHENEHWLIWSSGYKLHIARLLSPTALDKEQVIIAEALLPFETVSGPVCEGPAVLRRGSCIHVIYSANDSKCDEYCLGRISFAGGSLLDPAAWRKHPEAVFSQTEEIYGPGHCSFTEGDNGETYIVYHANLERGSGWHGRSIWAQRVEWDENDDPLFGAPHF